MNSGSESDGPRYPGGGPHQIELRSSCRTAANSTLIAVSMAEKNIRGIASDSLSDEYPEVK